MGIGLCEFESHLPHKETSSQGLVSFAYRQVAENLSETIAGRNYFITFVAVICSKLMFEQCYRHLSAKWVSVSFFK